MHVKAIRTSECCSPGELKETLGETNNSSWEIVKELDLLANGICKWKTGPG